VVPQFGNAARIMKHPAYRALVMAMTSYE